MSSKYSEDLILQIGVDYEAGIMSKSKIAQKYSSGGTNLSRQTVEKWAKTYKWKYAINKQKLSKKISDKVTAQLIEHSSNVLLDVDKKHIKNLEGIENLTQYNLSKFSEIIKESGEVTKSQSETLHAAQKFLNEAVKTLNVSFLDKRKAFGLDKDKVYDKPILIERIEFNGIDPDGPPPE